MATSLRSYTKKLLIQRIWKHVNDGFPKDDFTVSDTEMCLYIDQAIAATMIGQVFSLAKVEGNLVMPEAYLTTYEITSLTNDTISEYWYATLPQPPVGLPLGYSINRVYFGQSGSGQSKEVLPIEARRVGFRELMPLPKGARYWVENERIWIAAADGTSFTDLSLFVTMAKTRTEDLNEVMALPDDAIEMIFQNVVAKLTDRMQRPKDVIKDDLPSSNTNVRQ